MAEPSGWSLEWSDVDHDDHFSLDELIAGSFTGFTAWTFYHYWQLIGVPNTTTTTPFADGQDPIWEFVGQQFGGIGPLGFTPQYWTYEVSLVPIPSAGLLLGSGLLGLIGWRRFRKS